MKFQLGSLLAGTLFGLGLAISQMINPEKVIAFLDIAGNWDPSLALVLFAAVAVSAAGYRLAARRTAPILADDFATPARSPVDGRLLAGAAVFGIGWGLGGYCPGPAVSALAIGSWEPVVFLVALLGGSLASQGFDRLRS